MTHIHLDHAGSAGVLCRRFPHLKVYVHERGARHLADPSKLLASAERIYGDDMERLWGEFAPVPEERIVALAGGERIEGGFQVEYTPGHASHHVSYFDEDAAAGHRRRGLAALARRRREPPADGALPDPLRPL